MQTSGHVPFTKDDELLEQSESEPALHDCVRFPDDFLIERRGLDKYLTTQLSVSRLNAIHHWLWRAGLPGRVQPLHHQQVLQRAIVVTERVELHLVWTNDRIFIKPLAPFLINHAFFTEHISPNPTLLPLALGFLHSYTKLIQHRIDFSLSQELGLVPHAVTWAAWNRFRMSIRNTVTHSHQINKRYHYGELRLSRLNDICRFREWKWREGYFLVYTRYQSFFRANFEWLLLVFAYVSVALSALQVLLTADQDHDSTNQMLRRVSLGIGSASMVSVVTSILVMAVLFVVLKLMNEAFARGKRAIIREKFTLLATELPRVKH